MVNRREKKRRDWIADRDDLVEESKVGIWFAIIVFVIVVLGTLVGKK